METKTKKREWVKTAAIIFLSVLLVLTFFSNTIMNHSLPEVAAQYVESGPINAKIRGSGTVTANEAYEVMLTQTRKIESVLVRVGDEVKAGDPLFKLESMESEELKQAQKQLKDMQLAYQQKLINQGNASSTEDREIQKLRDEYTEAVRIYQIYSTMDPAEIEMAVKDSENDLREMEQSLAALTDEITKLESNLTEEKANEAIRLAKMKELEDEIEHHKIQLDGLLANMMLLDEDKLEHESNYNWLEQTAASYPGSGTHAERMAEFAKNPEVLAKETETSISKVKEYIESYDVLNTDLEGVMSYLDKAPKIEDEPNFKNRYDMVKGAYISQKTTTTQNKKLAESEYQEISAKADGIDQIERDLEQLKLQQDRSQEAVNRQKDVVANYNAASGAAERVKSTEDALEQKLFEASLGDPESLTFAADQEAIELQKELIEELTKEADGQEVLAKVSGIISSINVTAGGTGTPDTPVATITVADRGYMLKIPVTNEQARQVRVGDTAEVTNYYWGDISATLENIAGDPSSGGKGKLLLFRINGEGIESGTNLTLSIGQKSANYDCLVPNSAIRSDSNGSFVLVVVAKSSPLGNRYKATRADVQVLAADDTKSAVTGLAYGDYVITNSTKPIEAGQQVRLVDE